MYPKAFDYVRAESVEDALEQLAEHGEDARILAGGMSLVPMMKYRQRTPALLVDIGRLRELAGIAVEDGEVRIGATTRHHEAASWDEAPALPLLPEIAGRIGDRQVRNMGTVGGGLAAVEPTGDWGPALLALRGAVTARSRAGERTIAADDLFLDAHRSALRPDELLTGVSLPVPPSGFGAAQEKFELRAAAAALMSAVAALTLGEDGAVQEIGLACIGLGGPPVRLVGAEAAIRGQVLSEESVEAAVEAAQHDPAAASASAFRRAICGDLVRGALRRAQERALAGAGLLSGGRA